MIKCFIICLLLTTNFIIAKGQGTIAYSFPEKFGVAPNLFAGPVKERPLPYKLLRTPPGITLKRVGRGLTIGGTVLLASGVILMTTYHPFDPYEEVNWKLVERDVFGVIMIAAGVEMFVPGVILWTKGSHRYKKWHADQNLSVKINGNGLSLRLKF